MLEFLIGKACTGKSFEIVRQAAEASKYGKTVIIVPEQFSFETERAIIKYDSAVSENIHVLSFSRLFDEIAEVSGSGRFACVSDFEKLIILKKSVKACLDQLTVFARYAAYNDFISSLSDTIRDIKFSAITPEILMLIAENIGGASAAKLKDIAIIMSTYDALISNKYIDPSDRLTKLADMLVEVNYFENSTVFFDSFTGFTGQQYKIIEKIIEQADNITFSFCTDDIYKTDLGLFHNINAAARRVAEIAKNRGCNDFKITTKNETYYSCDGMELLESFLCENKVLSDCKLNGAVEIISCENKREEALAAANIIARDVAEKGYRFKDFITVARNADDYASLFERKCKQNNVSCFMDKSVSLTHTPIFIYVEKLFESISSFSTDSVLGLLKLGLNDFSFEEISNLEDYTFIWDIHPSDWKEDWELSVKGLRTDEDSEFDKKRLENINITRAKLVNTIFDFKDALGATAKSKSKAIYNHLLKNHIDKNLTKLCDCFENDGNQYYASILKQSWDVFIDVLDSLVRVLGDDVIDNAEYFELLKVAAIGAKISNVPQMLDEVTFGAADRIRPSKPKVSIILGANQGVFPKAVSTGGLLSAVDKQRLLELGYILDDDRIRGAIEENYLVYSMMCCPVDKVYVLYSRSSFSGEELLPSSFISEITQNFSDVSVKTFSLSSSGEFCPRTYESAFAELGSFNETSFADVVSSISDNSLFSEKLSFVSKQAKDYDFSISTKNASDLFGNEIRISATKFDTYHRCSLSFLLKNGLRLNKLEKADLNVLQRGTIAHFVLECMVSKHKENLASLSKLQISAEVDTLIHEYMSSVNGSKLLMTARFAYLLEKISQSVKEIVFHLAEEFAQSKFEPICCELSIGDGGDIPKIEYHLDNGTRLDFEGKIDRVDIYNEHVRVVDYKTGKKSFLLSDTLVGLNMQMLLYLYAFVKNGEKFVSNPKPAGILYMPAKASKDKKTLRMNGLILKDEDVCAAMEIENKGKFIPKFSDKSSDFVDAELFDLIFKKIDSLMHSMGANIVGGNFEANPTDGVKSDACAYCDFASICRSNKKPHKKTEMCSNDNIKAILNGGENNGI